MDNQTLLICSIVIAAILLVMAIVRLALWIQWFRRELRYVNKEINRTTGKEREHWIRRKKRLFLSIIPFWGY